MNVISPTYRIGPVFGPLEAELRVRRATELPVFEARTPDLPGTLLEFTESNEELSIDVPMPRLPGLDEIEVEEVRFDLSTAEREEVVSVHGTPAANGGLALNVVAAPDAGVRLKRIEIDDLRITASPALSFIVAGSSAWGSLSSVAYTWDAANGRTQAVANGSASPADWVHLLVRSGSGSGVGPPVAAAPHFAMPGAGGGMYGPALGSASLVLTRTVAGAVQAVLRPVPPLTGGRFVLLLGRASRDGPHAGLPNEVTPVPWSAPTVRAVFDVRPSRIKVEASTASLSTERPLVAEFPTDPGDAPVPVEFAPVARSLLRKSYPLAQGSDLGLRLLVTAGSPGTVRIHLGSARARYLHFPLEQGPASLALRGAPETVNLTVPSGLRPSALSFTVDGVYGPARLTLDSDTGVPETRHGFRVGGVVQVARRIALTATEAHLPLSRLAVFGRASEASELLLTLHQGDVARVGPPVAEPMSLILEPQARPGWQRVPFKAPGLLPPHPEFLWLVVRSTRGVFWWHGSLSDSGFTSRSADEGLTFMEVAGRPQLQVAVHEVDSVTQLPAPLLPLALSWEGGLLNSDLVGIGDGAIGLSPAFRRFWIAEGPAHAAFLNRIAELDGSLILQLTCGRDVEVNVSESVLTYDPWRAGEPAGA